MAVNNLFYVVEPQPKSFYIVDVTGWYSEKTSEYLFAEFFWNANPVVLKSDGNQSF